MSTSSATDPRHAEATRHMQSGAFQAAIPLLEALLDEDPDDADLLNDAALAHAQENDWQKAETYLRRALDSRPDFEAAFYNLLDLSLKGDHSAKAQSSFLDFQPVIPDSEDKERYFSRLFDIDLSRLAQIYDRGISDKDSLIELLDSWCSYGWAAGVEYLEAIAELCQNSNRPVLECGSGVTTLLLGMLERGDVFTLEHDFHWYRLLRYVLDYLNLDNVNLIHAPLKDYQSFSWYTVPEALRDIEFGLVVCDGPPGNTKGGRVGLMPVMGDELGEGCTILLDDVNRYGELKTLRKWDTNYSFSLQFRGKSRNFAYCVLDQVEPSNPSGPFTTEDHKLTSNGLDILFVQNSPCIRNYKTAKSLIQYGHRVSLAYTGSRLSQMYEGLSDDVYDSCFKIDHHQALWELGRHYDLVHCHNEPDILTVAALSGDTPVVHDTHDLISLRHPGNKNISFFESLANRGADGRIYASPGFMKKAMELYDVDPATSISTFNYPLQSDIPRQLKPKLSDLDGKLHLVYQGSTGNTSHRDFFSFFRQLADLGCHVHIYSPRIDPRYQKLDAEYDTIHYHLPVSPTELISILSQYDIGLVPFTINDTNIDFLDLAVPNKIFEYAAAGLPVATANTKSLSRIVDQDEIGIVYNSPEDIIESKDYILNIDVKNMDYRFENQVHKYNKIYETVIKNYN